MPVHNEAARYREAARLALQQVDWCVIYLHSINKNELARALAKNSSAISHRLAGIETDPVATPARRGGKGFRPDAPGSR
jgi:hypothetical protein